MLNEFKRFAMRGNVIDLAIGIIIGGAFNKIITSMVNDIIMPPIGLILARVNFANLYINLSSQKYPSLAAAQAAGAPTINYGIFITNVLDFLIVAFIIFLAVMEINRLKDTPQPQPPTTKDCPYCLSTIPLLATRCPQCTSELAAKAAD